jgi:hypothetical protein
MQDLVKPLECRVGCDAGSHAETIAKNSAEGF